MAVPRCEICGWVLPRQARKYCSKDCRKGAYKRRQTWILLKSRHNITKEQYLELLEAQNGGCAACGAAEPWHSRLSVDHDHSCCPGEKSCGRCIRGLLCSHCNITLGFAQESLDRLLGLATYLKAFQSLERK